MPNHKVQRISNEPIESQSKHMKTIQSTRKCGQMCHQWVTPSIRQVPKAGHYLPGALLVLEGERSDGGRGKVTSFCREGPWDTSPGNFKNSHVSVGNVFYCFGTPMQV